MLRATTLIGGWMLTALLSGCAGSQASHEISVGRIALVTGNPAQALKHFEQAAALDAVHRSPPLQESAWTYVGRARYEIKEYPLARQAFERALGLNRNDAVAGLYLGLVSARAESNDASRRQIQEGLQALESQLEYIKRYTPMGEFWDPSGRLSGEITASIKTFATVPNNWRDAITEAERLGLDLEKEIDASRSDESYQRRSGGSGSGDM
jgi:tetratricopeptide (TPR) repeat protein